MSDSGSQGPQQFGNYLLLERVAMGGMAEIFRAKKLGAEGFEKELVIKRVLPHYSEDEAFITMFKDEAKIAANLNHANICQVFEFDEQDGSFYIAMEYIPGRDLKHVVEDGFKQDFPMSVGQVTWVIAQVAAGLHYAHVKEYNGQSLKIVHRDCTPHNIMVSMSGDVKLMDFGIAKAAARSTRTQAGTVKGKCAYMSPEQARGKDLDGRSDVFALGITMWEALTGKRLFLGESEFETLSNVLKKAIPALAEVGREVPGRAQEILSKSLARNRDERYETAAAFERDLLSFFYSECNPNMVKLDEYMKYLFGDGPKPDLGASSMIASVADTLAMPSVSPDAATPPPPLRIGDTGENEPTAVGESLQPPPPPPPQLRSKESESTTLPMEPSGNVPASASPSAAFRPIDASPGLTAYTGSHDSGRRMGLIVGGAVVALLAVGGIGYAVFGGDDDSTATEAKGSGDGDSDEESGADETTPAASTELRVVRIQTAPKGATVYLDGDNDLAQRTPFEVKRKPGHKLKIKARKSGYKTMRTNVDVETGAKPQLVKLTLKKK